MLSSYKEDGLEAGCDEAGRGCLAGPVVAAAVILKPDFDHPLLNDSKKVKEKDRNILRKDIIEEAIAWGIGLVSPEEIDQINILNASIKAMHLALDGLKRKPNRILVDGNFFLPYQHIPHHCFVKGDSKFKAIAAASILAKTYRDDLMANLDLKHPEYQWISNKGYPTATHRKAILNYGFSKHHRKTFKVKKLD
jgi:ribonuclease HII